VMGVVPEQLKPFDQVKDEVAKNWRAEEARTKAAKYAQELVASLNSGKTLEDIAKELNVEVLTSDPLKRESITVNVLPPSVQQAFALPEKGYGSGPSGVEEGRIVFQVDKVRPPETLDDKERDRIKNEIELLLRQDAIDEYSGALEKRYGVTINQQALAKLIGSDEVP
jgi:peptidyl-prolyl cis-trans isomerase D